MSRQDEIERKLFEYGYQMECSLASFDGSGHAVIDISNGEVVDPPPGEVMSLAEEWSLIEGVEE